MGWGWGWGLAGDRHGARRGMEIKNHLPLHLEKTKKRVIDPLEARGGGKFIILF